MSKPTATQTALERRIDAAILHNSQNSFLQLPGETRNNIYNYMFEERRLSPFYTKGTLSVGQSIDDYVASQSIVGAKALKYVCVQLHEETAMYEVNTTVFDVLSLARFMLAGGQYPTLQQKALTHLKILVRLGSNTELKPFLSIGSSERWYRAFRLPNLRRVDLDPCLGYVRAFVEGAQMTREVTKDNLRKLDEWFFEGGAGELRVVCGKLQKIERVEMDMQELKDMRLRIEFEDGSS